MDRRKAIVKEEKPTNLERVTLEFNLVYNELLASVRDRDTAVAQQKFIMLYNLYRKLSKENLSKAEMDELEKRLKAASSFVPTEKPPKAALMILAIIGIWSIIGLMNPGITGMAVYEEQADYRINEIIDMEVNLAIGENEVLVYNLDKAPSSLSISGRVLSSSAGIAKVYLVEDALDPNSYKLITSQRVTEGANEFEYACTETCYLENFGKSSVVLVAKVDGALLELNSISYS
jgi:hypothetical protein